MCLAIPLQLVEAEGSLGLVRSSGLGLEVALDLVPEARTGDYVIVHAGYAIQSLSADEAHETLTILRRLEESWQDE